MATPITSIIYIPSCRLAGRATTHRALEIWKAGLSTASEDGLSYLRPGSAQLLTLRAPSSSPPMYLLLLILAVKSILHIIWVVGTTFSLPCLLCGSITQLLFSCRIHQGFPRRTTHPLLEREQWPCRPTLEARAWHPRSTLPVFTRHLHLCTSNRCLSVAMMRCAMFPQQQALMAALSTTS